MDQIEVLLDHATVIEHKFAEGNLDDIDAEFVSNIIRLIKTQEISKHNPIVQSLVQEIEVTCYSAIRYYKDNNYALYMARVRAIARMIRGLSEKI